MKAPTPSLCHSMRCVTFIGILQRNASNGIELNNLKKLAHTVTVTYWVQLVVWHWGWRLKKWEVKSRLSLMRSQNEVWILCAGELPPRGGPLLYWGLWHMYGNLQCFGRQFILLRVHQFNFKPKHKCLIKYEVCIVQPSWHIKLVVTHIGHHIVS